MEQPLFLSITNHYMVVYSWESDSGGEEMVFDQGEAGVARFQDYMQGVTGRPALFILIDLTEEELKVERMPRVNPLHRSRLLESRVNRLMRNTPFRYATLLGRDPQDKNQDCVLFSGLTDPEETVQPWLTVIEALQFPLAGIWSIPLLMPRLFRDVVDAKHQNVMLLSINSGGLRQIFMRSGQILISRLSRLPSGDPLNLVSFLYGEVARMQGYLVSQRLYTWNSELQVHVLCDEEFYALMDSAPREVGSSRFHLLNVTQLGVQVGLKMGVTVGKMDRLFGQCVLSWAIPNHYARGQDTLVFRTLRLRRRLRWVAAGLYAISLVFGLILFFQGRNVQEQLPELSRQAEEIQQSGRESFNGYSFQEGRRIINISNWAERLESQAMDPRVMLRTIGQLLAVNETLMLENIEWSVEETPAQVVKSPGPKSRPPAQTGAPSSGKGALQLIRLSGRVISYTTLKDAMMQVERFIQELRVLPEVVDVQPLQLPMNVGLNGVIQGGGEPLNQDKAVFNLKILLARQ